jgi:hypothetical protein
VYLTTGELWLEGASLVAVDLTGATIKGQFALSHEDIGLPHGLAIRN